MYWFDYLKRNGVSIEELKSMVDESCREYGVTKVFNCAYVKDDFSGKDLGDGFFLMCPGKNYFVSGCGIVDAENGEYVCFEKRNLKANNKRAKKPDYQDLFGVIARKMATKISDVAGKEMVDKFAEEVVDFCVAGEQDRCGAKIKAINDHHNSEKEKDDGVVNEDLTNHLTKKAYSICEERIEDIKESYITMAKSINPKSRLREMLEVVAEK